MPTADACRTKAQGLLSSHATERVAGGPALSGLAMLTLSGRCLYLPLLGFVAKHVVITLAYFPSDKIREGEADDTAGLVG